MNRILMADSYKQSHQVPNVYPSDTVNLHSYGEARVGVDKEIVFLGLQGFIQEYLMKPITQEELDEATDVLAMHGVDFNREAWQYIVDKHKGHLPLRIMAVPEGSVVPGGTPLWTVELSYPNAALAWLPSFIETALQRAIWYPSTIASNDRQLWKYLKAAYDYASDAPELMGYSYHDFGARGVSSEESAAIGGMAHLVYFNGTDNLSAIRYVRKNYNTSFIEPAKKYMPGHSVNATEHSIQCSFGSSRYDQKSYIINTLRTLGKRGGIVSIVMDGFDFERELATVCSPEIVDLVRTIGCKLVVRPDSGDPVEMLPSILHKLEAAYGYDTNSKGFKVLRDVGVIWGDGIDHSLGAYLYSKVVLNLNFAPENLVLGSGGALLQKVNRDTYRFAQKAAARLVPSGAWLPVKKEPRTDASKTSKAGIQTSKDMKIYYDSFAYTPSFESLEEIRERARR